MRTRTREPQTLASEGTLDRMARILAARNIDPAAVAELTDEPEPFSPLDALSAGMPPRSQAAVGRPPPRKNLGPGEAPGPATPRLG
ncbi:hypothetical protein ACFXPJ_11640, partial [Streptomyces goshikiensis]